jgi:hypothetical protein
MIFDQQDAHDFVRTVKATESGLKAGTDILAENIKTTETPSCSSPFFHHTQILCICNWAKEQGVGF